ncbi:MAG: FtsW/RodA/SpoVE family cell cycle protein [Paludibacteraceae bacterium]|nr:FtsW/RodA/SpoVE family cell cycle protein [Paludibacteraceae bacterium]
MNYQLKQILSGDKYVKAVFIFLLLISLIATYSAMSRIIVGSGSTSTQFVKHSMFLLFGIIIAETIKLMDFGMIRKLGYLFLIGAFVLMMTVFAKGGGRGGSMRFSQYGQPFEFVKLGIVLVMADQITRFQKKEYENKAFWYVVFTVLCLFILPIATQNLSTALIIFGVMILMMWIGNVDAKRIFGFAAILISLVILALQVPRIVDYEVIKDMPGGAIIERAYTWRSRVDELEQRKFGKGNQIATEEKAEENVQVTASKVALLNGGWFPHGPGSSKQRNALPEAHNDYVFAIACEEWGFVMGVMIVLAYLIVVWRSIRYQLKAEKYYRGILVFGCSMLILIQAVVHIAVSVGVIPVTGQPLPMVSQGGSSILVMSACFGIILKATAGEDASSIFNVKTDEEAKTDEEVKEEVEVKTEEVKKEGKEDLVIEEDIEEVVIESDNN